MNKKLLAILLCVVMVTSVTMTACGNENATTAPTTTAPEGSSSVVTAKDVNVVITLGNNYGKVLEGVTLLITGNSGNFEATTDANGTATLILTEGKYKVDFENLPEYHLSAAVDMEVKDGMGPFAIEIESNEPNGTEQHPFHLGEEADTRLYTANAQIWYSARVGEGRTIVIENMDVEVSYNGQVYTPDENGRIQFDLVGDDPRAQVLFCVTNKLSVEMDVTIDFLQAQGVFDNPVVIEDIHQTFTCVVPDGDYAAYYYKWIATEAGVLTISCDNSNNSIGMNNITTYEVTSLSDGAPSISIDVNVGDEILIEISVVTSHEGGDEITFTMAIEPKA